MRPHHFALLAALPSLVVPSVASAQANTFETLAALLDDDTALTMAWGADRTTPGDAASLIRSISQSASEGETFTLHLGARTPSGLPDPTRKQMATLTEWVEANKEAITGTEGSPFEEFRWGRCTMNYHGENHLAMTSLYFHVDEWPTSGVLRIDNLGNRKLSASILGAPDRPVGVEDIEGVLFLQVGTEAPGPHVNVVKLDVSRYPLIFRTPTIDARRHFVDSTEVTINTGSSSLDAHYTLDGTEPSADSPRARGPITISRTCTIRVRAFHDGEPIAGIAEAKLERVTPQPATGAPGRMFGLRREVYRGNWNNLPDFDALTPETAEHADHPGLPSAHPGEYVGHRYTGMIHIEEGGLYTFALTSDDGSRLFINDTIVVDNDGLHGSITATGSVALAEGWHPIRMEWFNKTGGVSLNLRMSTEGEALEPIPEGKLSY